MTGSRLYEHDAGMSVNSNKFRQCDVTIQFYIVDTFTDIPFKGNPCAVCIMPDDTEIKDEVLRKIAGELNKSETAFIRRLQRSDTFEHGQVFGLRWITPKKEVRMCGNGTLSAAAVLFHKLGNKRDQVVFKTLLGELIVKKEGDFIHIDFPVGYTVRRDHHEYKELIKSLGDIPDVLDIAYCEKLRYILIRLQDGWSMGEFEAWTPDLGAMLAPSHNFNSVIVTTRGPPDLGYKSSCGAPYDFVSRCFTPWTVVPEHQATGSTKTVLVHYWSQQLNKTDFFVKQCSQRSGEFVMKLRGDRVELLGKTTFVMEGVLTL